MKGYKEDLDKAKTSLQSLKEEEQALKEKLTEARTVRDTAKKESGPDS
jgi:hypothetical protein